MADGTVNIRSAPSPAQLDAAVARAEQLQQRGRLQEAYEASARVLASAPGHPGANHLQGLLLHQAGRHAEAAEAIGNAVAAAPGNAVYRSNLGVVLKEAGRLEEAVASYEAALRIDPAVVQTHSNLGVALLGLGRVEEAVAAQQEALSTDPSYAEAHANLGLALMEQGALEAAVASCRAAIGLKPQYANGHQYLAKALGALGRLAEAEASARQAVALNPLNAAGHHLLANVLVEEERCEEAIASYQEALRLRPDATAFRKLGELLSDRGDFREAAAAFRGAISINESDAAAHAGLGYALFSLGGMPRAVESYRRAIALDPDNPRYRDGIAPALVGVGLLDEAVASFRAAAEEDPKAIGANISLLFIGNYLDDLSPDDIARQSAALGKLLQERHPPRSTHGNTADPDRRLKVGLVSGDLNMHPVAFFLENVLRAIDPVRIELLAYATSGQRDRMTETLQGIIPHWRDAALFNDDRLEAAVLEDGIDILVDLSGYTQNGRLPLFARKPAPVAVNWLGYSGTTGLAAIDYVLADGVVAPVAEERLFTETVWRMPDSYLCFSPPAEVGEVAPLPALANGHVTFGSFNNLNKVNDRTVALWARVLEAVPGSRLAFKSGALRRAEAGDELRARFAARGIEPARLKLLPYETRLADHLGAYREVDIGLDPFPYNGTTTTCDAMLMGVPVLTLRGDRFIAHVGESLVRTVGLDDWVAADEDAFVAKAAAFAAHLPALSELRVGLRPRFLASPLCDAPRFARNLEAALRGMWRNWCAAQEARR